MADFEAIFELDDIDKIDCIFDISATVYNYEELDKLPQINGETLIGNKTSEELHLGSKEDVERLEQNIQNEATTRAENDTLLQNNINTLDEKVDGINVNLTQQIEETQQDVNAKYNELVNDIDEEIQAREQADTTINQRITDVADELNQTIEENVVALQQEDAALQNQINAHSTTLTAYDTRITNNANAISQEITNRQNADDNLQEQIDNLRARGRFLSLWNATTGLAETNPEIDPYPYNTGDYFIVGTVGETNYKPTGTQYVIGQASTVVETEELATEDVYYFDGSVWHLQVNHGKTVSFGNLAGQPSDNIALKQALDGKQDVIEDLTDYVKNTDYASESVAGVIKPRAIYGTIITSNGYIAGTARTNEQYKNDSTALIISKSTLENIKEDLVTSVGDSKYQDKLTAGNGIDITDNKISTNTQFVITEDMFDIEYDDTKGVAPYSSSYGYTNVTIKSDAGVEWVEGASYSFVLDTKISDSLHRNVRIRIGESGDWKPLMNRGGTIVAGTTYFVKAMNIPFQYSTKYQPDGALHSVEYNTTYSINYSFDNGQHTGGVGAYAITRYSLCMQKPNMSWEKITNTSQNYSTGTTKTVNKTGFLLNHIRYYGGTINIANGALITNNIMYTKSASVDASYSFNCSTTPNWGVGKQVYIVGTVKDDGLFYLDENQWWSVELPTSNDGKLYIRIGLTYNATNATITFLDDRPIVYHDGTGIKEYVPHDNTKQDVIEDLGDIRNNIATNTSNISYLDGKVRDIELFKFPNAVIIGEPTISNGQVSGFSTMSYLQFPFILDLHNQAFQIDFSFTTATNVQTQQNILDSNFGLALAIANGKGLMAISSNGTSWDIGSTTGTMTIQSNTTYYARLIWNRLQYKTQLSTDGVNYTDDMIIVDTRSPYPRTIFIGGCDQLETGHAPHPFLGTINMNKAYLSVMGSVIWQGMDDAGLSTRADLSLSNLDELGEKRFADLQDAINTKANNSDLTAHTSNGTIHVTASDKIAWSQKQNTSDDDLTTTNKTVVGAINELNSNKQPAGDYATNTDLTNGLATKQNLLTAGNNITIENDVISVADDLGFNNPYSLFDCKFADHLLNNASWLRADTFEWHSGDVYVDAYNMLVEEYNNGVERINDVSSGAWLPEYKISQSGFIIATAEYEQNVIDRYNTYGITWIYILDTVNKRFKLPRTKWGFKGFRGEVGVDIDESLPNIKGQFNNDTNGTAWQSYQTSGAFTATAQPYNGDASTSQTQVISPRGSNVIFDASNSSSTYQDNAPVQERGTQMYLYFYVGETVQNANLIDAGRIAEQLTTKVDVASSWGFPSSRYIDLTLGASGTTYTAPANGYVQVGGYGTTSGSYVIIECNNLNFTFQSPYAGQLYARGFIPVKKGTIFRLFYDAFVFEGFRFIYAQGAE